MHRTFAVTRNLHRNSNNADEIIAEVVLNAVPIAETNEAVEGGIEDLGEGENDSDFSDEED